MRNYELSPTAKVDIREITHYTLDTWGKEQNDKYTVLLEDCFEKIGIGNVTPRRFTEALPEVLLVRCEHHYIFYLQPKSNEPVIIFAILHKNMNLIKRIKEMILK